MPSTDPKPTTITLSGTVRRGYGRNAQHTAVFGAGLVTATAPTAREARDQLAQQLTAHIINGLSVSPAFASDDDGSLIVAIPHGTGCSVWRWTPGGVPRETTLAEGTPAEYVARVHHFTPAPTR